MSPFRLLTLLALLLVLPLAAQAQDERADTAARLEALRAQIRQQEAELSQTTREEEASLETLEQVERQISVREELARTSRRRLRQLSTQSRELERELGQLEIDLATLREQYRARARHAYMHGRLHDLALIFSARSINEMLVRVRYLHRFAEDRRRQADEIRMAAATLEERRDALATTRAQTQRELAEAEREQDDLADLRAERQRVIEGLQSRREELEAELARQRAAVRDLEARLRRIIARAEEERVREVPTQPPADLAAFRALSGSFRDNRGSLPWPSDGVVTEPFGEIVNPVHGTRTTNPGVLISTPPAAPVRAVFEGDVIGVDAMPEFGTLIVVRHGPQYQSLYANLSALYVQTGDHVEAGQLLGRAGTQAEPKGPGLFFGMFNEGREFDPQGWLSRR